MVWPRISADRRGLNPNYDSDPRLSAFIRGLNIDPGNDAGLIFWRRGIPSGSGAKSDPEVLQF